MSVYREILRHSAVYGVGHLLARLASVLLLPLYTSYLTPADYGIIAVLDVTLAVFEMLAAGGIAAACIRFSADPAYERSQHTLWTTGLCILGAIALPQLILAWLFRDGLVALTLGPGIPQGALYYELAVYTLAANLVSNFGSTYLRVQKRSGLFVTITSAVLVLRIALNIWTIAGLQIGVLGFLLSGLVAGGCQALVVVWLLFFGKPFRLLPDAFGRLWSYGWPLIVTGIASLMMHQADRYLLRWITGDMGQVGIYSLAFNLAQGVNAFVLGPFSAIWSTVMFEVHLLPDRLQVFRRVYRGFTLGLWLVMVGLALFSVPIVRVISAEEYHSAAQFLPVLCLALLFYPLHSFFSLPAAIHRSTGAIAVNSLVAAGVKVASGIVLIQAFGLWGAAISAVLTYAVFSFGGHLRYRRIEDMGWGLQLLGVLVLWGAGLVGLMEWLAPPTAGLATQAVWAGVLWGLSAGAVLLGPGRPVVLWLARRRARGSESRTEIRLPAEG
ncbi:MAG: oligosaccharide flippase family protein [Planctomycetes bacterium]|nr:oligosaccharide flippase family protein [Planctomycetota bacterium]